MALRATRRLTGLRGLIVTEKHHHKSRLNRVPELRA